MKRKTPLWQKGCWADNPNHVTGWRVEYAKKAIAIVDEAIVKMMSQK